MFAIARQSSASMARILMYHNFRLDDEKNSEAVSVTNAREQLQYLQRHFHVVPLLQIVDQLRSGKPLSKYSVALTIDDGRRNFYEHFFPLLKQFQVPATFFVVTSFIGHEDWIWTDKVLWLAEHSRHADELSPARIGPYFQELNRLAPTDRNEKISRLARHCGLSIPIAPPAQYAPCSWAELREMSDSGLVEIGSHTATHPILSSISDEQSGRELTDSRHQIQEKIGKEVQLFCFPNGQACDYRTSHFQLLKDAGYGAAVVTRFGMAGADSTIYELPRMGISGMTDMLTFSKYLDGVEYYQDRLCEYIRWLQRPSPKMGATHHVNAG